MCANGECERGWYQHHHPVNNPRLLPAIYRWKLSGHDAASDNAKFGQPEVNLGIIPGYGGTQRLVQLIGKGRAMELLMSAAMIDAATALQYGLVNYVVAPENLLDKAISVLTVINSKAPLAVAGCIKAANAVFDQNKNGFDTEAAEFGKCFGTADMKEGTTAFLEKRKAVFHRH